MLGTILSVGVPVVVKLVDRLLGRGGGATKKSTALDILRAIVQRFAAPGVGLPGDGELADLVEGAVAVLNQRGELQGEKTIVDPALTDARLAEIGYGMIRDGVALLARGGALSEGK